MTEDRERLTTAMCLWESLLNRREGDERVKLVWENIGTVAMRYHCAEWVDPCNAAWEGLSGEEKECNTPFDWEWVPSWISTYVDWSNDHQPILIGLSA